MNLLELVKKTEAVHVFLLLVVLAGWTCSRRVLPRYPFELIHAIKRTILLDLLQLLDCHHNTGAGRQTIPAVWEGPYFLQLFSLITIVIPASSLCFCLEFRNLSLPLESKLLVNWIFFPRYLFFWPRKRRWASFWQRWSTQTHTHTHPYVPQSDFIRSLHWDYVNYPTLHLLSLWLDWWSWWGLL